MTYEDACNRMAAVLCYREGWPVAVIAASAKKSASTIRRWLKEMGIQLRGRHT